MNDEVVLDASVAAKLFIDEDDADRARALLDHPTLFRAPDLIFAELANVAVKRVRRGEIPDELAEEMMRQAPGVIAEAASNATLMQGAYRLARDHGLSAYDAAYLALAQALGTVVVTADLRLAERAEKSGLGHLIKRL